MVGDDVIVAIKHFFNLGRLLKDVNATFISLVPKKIEASSNDFKPIALCNLLNKFIIKILANRLKKVMNGLVRPNQTAFIGGRSITENILLCHEVVRGFERKNHTQDVVMKIDLRKAYDSISWDFMREVLEKMGFPNKFSNWVME